MNALIVSFARWLVKSVYKVDRRGWDAVPREGGAVLVSNHLSYIDGLVIATSCDRPIRFVMDHRIFASRIGGFFFRHARAIPIAPAKENADLKERAFAEIAKALRHGELVCIFPEGRLSPTGELQTFQSGIERIIAETPVPVVPIALGGLWGSVFSRAKRANAGSLTDHVRRRIRAICGRPLAPEAVSSSFLQQRVQKLAEEG
ncbi:MAG: 1-acyl-sn-glycerol-3-phosphate acyltransferase [Polyangiaceae bacterium]